MNNRELLELAATGAGFELDWDVPDGASPWVITGADDDRGPGYPWNPLEDDGDALRLAVRLCMTTTAMTAFCGAKSNLGGMGIDIPTFDARQATMRLAIVTVAAEIGKRSPA